MSKEYDHIAAFHYSAFRPALHSRILKEYLNGHASHGVGLDIGSGVGHSSIALAEYCNKVVGVEPSRAMLAKSIPHPRVEYALYDRKHLDFENENFDIITFAGSLHYAKSPQTLEEVIRVSKNATKIVIYDFELLLDDILGILDMEDSASQKSKYDHQVNLSESDRKNIETEHVAKKSVSVEIGTQHLVHLLLSSKHNYRLLLKLFGPLHLYKKVLKKLNSVLTTEEVRIEGIAYIAIYTVMK